ncbi:unnamed protein product [Diamesa hyperborea]
MASMRMLSRMTGMSAGWNWNLIRSCSQGISYIHRVGTEPLQYKTIGQILQQSAEKYSDREALVSCHEKTRLTFAETLEKADHLAAGLLNLGLVKGDRVAIYAPNFTFWYISFMAVARAGLISVGLNSAYQLPELEFCIKKVGVSAIIAPEVFKNQKYYEMMTKMLPQLTKSGNQIIENNTVNSLKAVIMNSNRNLPGTVNYDELLQSASASDVDEIAKLQHTINPDSGANIQFSSGTTGKPKAVQVSHFNFVNNSYDFGKRLQLNEKPNRICLQVPLFHAYGVTFGMMNSLHHGATLVLPAPLHHPESSLKAIVDEKCNVIFGTPTMFVDLVAKQRELNVKIDHEIDFANTGGSICTPKLVQDVLEVLKAKKMKTVYGLTETTASVFQSRPEDDVDVAINTVGCLGDNIEAKVVDVNGKIVPFGQPGELWVRGYLTMMGYWDDKTKTDEVLDADGWFKTGDQFIIHENGYGQVVGRLKEMIIRGGENLFPREIEDFLNTHPNVAETHVIGIPDERMGEEVGAFIRLKDPSKPLTREDVKKFCSGSLAHFKIPRYVVIVENFPKTLSGKVQKFKFVEEFSEELKKIL